MKKWITLILALACVFTLAGCKEQRKLDVDVEDVGMVRLRSGLTGDAVIVAETTVVRKITNNIKDLTFESCKEYDGGNGYAYTIEWLSPEENRIAIITVLDKEGCQILYGGHDYRVADDLSIDTDYLRALLDAQYSEPIPDAPEDTWGVSMTVKDEISTGLTLVISHSGVEPEGELSTGTPYWVEVSRDGAWYQIPQVPPEDGIDRVWNDLAYIIPANGSWEQKVSLEWLYGELPAGTYRIGKEIALFREIGDRDEQTCYAEFEIN